MHLYAGTISQVDSVFSADGRRPVRRRISIGQGKAWINRSRPRRPRASNKRRLLATLGKQLEELAAGTFVVEHDAGLMTNLVTMLPAEPICRVYRAAWCGFD